MPLSPFKWIVVLAGTVWAAPALAVEYRTFDGSQNNLTHTAYGQAGQPLRRMAPANYADGAGMVDATRVNPRRISNRLFDQPDSQPDPRGLSDWVWVWGQFIDHDMDHTLTDGQAGGLEIEVPTDDPVFGDLRPTNYIQVTRSAFAAGTGNGSPRQQVNNISSWIDGSNVYGGRASDGPAGMDRPSWLRATDGTGQLKVSNGGPYGDLLPKYVDGLSPVMDNTHRPNMTGETPGDKAYVAGDFRANEHPALLMTHTLFVREHNRLTDILASTQPQLSSDEIYQRARKIVGTQIQAITYNEFLPALGVQLPVYSGYDATVDPAIANEFSTAGFRLHTQINETIQRLDAAGNPIPEGHLSLAEAFFTPDMLLEGGLEPLIRGLATQTQQATDAKIVGALRNQLFQTFIPGTGLVGNATDLAALNIMRGRDHGLATYNETRQAYGLSPASDYDDITSDPAVSQALEEIYGAGNVDDVDLYPGMLAEDPVEDSSLGTLAGAIISDQFLRLRDGDRFWFENNLDGVNEDLLTLADWSGEGDTPQTALEWIGGLQLSDIILMNTDVAFLQDNVFFSVPEPGAIWLTLFALLSLGLPAARAKLSNP